MYLHKYRVLKSSWGISIDISGQYIPMSSYANKGCLKEVCSGLWAITTEEVPQILQGYIWEGLNKVSELILLNTPYKFDTLIIINAISFGLCDFQEEGVTAAIIEWAASAFNFIKPKINVIFNKQQNKYEFEYHDL